MERKNNLYWFPLIAIGLVAVSGWSSQNKIHMWFFDPNFPREPFLNKYTEIHSSVDRSKSFNLPSTVNMDKMAANCSLNNYIKTWDQTEKDIFYLTLRGRPLTQVVKNYTKIPKDRLRQCQHIYADDGK